MYNVSGIVWNLFRSEVENNNKSGIVNGVNGLDLRIRSDDRAAYFSRKSPSHNNCLLFTPLFTSIFHP